MRFEIQMTSSRSVLRLHNRHLFLHELGAWACVHKSGSAAEIGRGGDVTCVQLCDEAQTVSNW